MTSTILKSIAQLTILCILFFLSACDSNKVLAPNIAVESIRVPHATKLNGGSSGMEQVGDHTYLVVYDLKGFQKGNRVGLVNVTHKSLQVSTIKIDKWDVLGLSSDLESVCSIPNKPNEYLMAESGNWKGEKGRIFHVKVDTARLSATIIGSCLIPQLYLNDMETVGDQYEAMICLPYDDTRRIVVLGERGGSYVNRHGVIRWGLYDLENHTFVMSEEGVNGIEVDVPGNWVDANLKRDVTDFHIDKDGYIWAAASEDQGDSGPFYSVIYKLGKLNPKDKEKPFVIFNEIVVWKDVAGFKIEALSGSCSDIKSNLSFGTEDENFNGVWRPISISPK